MGLKRLTMARIDGSRTLCLLAKVRIDEPGMSYRWQELASVCLKRETVNKKLESVGPNTLGLLTAARICWLKTCDR